MGLSLFDFDFYLGVRVPESKDVLGWLSAERDLFLSFGHVVLSGGEAETLGDEGDLVFNERGRKSYKAVDAMQLHAPSEIYRIRRYQLPLRLIRYGSTIEWFTVVLSQFVQLFGLEV